MEIATEHLNDLELKIVLEQLEHESHKLGEISHQMESVLAHLADVQNDAIQSAIESLEYNDEYQGKAKELAALRHDFDHIKKQMDGLRAILDRSAPTVLKKWLRP